MLKQYQDIKWDEMNEEQIYFTLLEMSKAMIKQERKQITGERKLYYISSEFLIGKLLSNNLINLGIYDQVQAKLQEHGIELSKIEEVELEPSLGNGGLGRLAACFIDSISTLNLPGDGVGLLYHYGLFKQVFVDNQQTAVPNPWLDQKTWLNETKRSYYVEFGKFSVESQLYEIDVLGFQKGYNKLKLFDIKTVNPALVTSGIDFDKEKIKENLTLFLYPDDSDEEGHLLRIYQQYFMVSNAVQVIFDEELEKGHVLTDLAQHVVIQINDTHPTLVIPELIYQLIKRGISLEQAIEITSQTCAYTNHTILAEALEKWPKAYLQEVVPHLMTIIEHLANLVAQKFTDPRVQIIDQDKRVHMAHICIHYGFSINGVAALHTDILKTSELKHFYELYPEKFNNKTNGITFRRWLMHSNRELNQYLPNLIGENYKCDAMELRKLHQYSDDQLVLKKLNQIKQTKKVQLKEYIFEQENISINENSIYDIQIKRLHEYKRQQMNALYIINKYLEIKGGKIPARPITFIFGAKAAPAYTIAQDIIHLLLSLSKLIENDPELKQHIQLVFVENYNVTYAEKLYPACDVSEQISLASKEASGTGNMKFMLNGAITLGTNDGANVEIKELVGDDNIYIFGKESAEIIEMYERASYSSQQIIDQDQHIAKLVEFIISDELMQIGHAESLQRLYQELITKDWFMTLIDLKDYIKVKDECFSAYEDRETWLQKSLINIAEAGFFSSDRTIKNYEDEIWQLRK